MATVEDFILRMKVEGQGSVKQVSGTIQTLKDDIADLGQVGGPLGNTINGIIGKLGPMGIAAGLAATAFATLGGRALTLAAELSDISGATGIAAGTLMNFRQSVVEAGGKAEDFAQIAAKLNQSIQEAASGNETFQRAFQRLGVFVTDANGKVRDTESILRDVISRFKSGQISSEQYAAAIDILGKNINKLELAKLNAQPDLFKDEQIKQIDKYNEAIDKLGEKFNNLAITITGKVAVAINGVFADIDRAIKANDELDRRLAEKGKAQVAPGLTGTLRGLLGMEPRTSDPIITRRLSDAEKAAAARKKYEEEMAKLMAPYQSRAGTRAEAAGGQTGGFGATPEATIKAREESLKRIKVLEIEQNRQTQLAANNERLSAILQFADQEEAIRLKSSANIKDIEINAQAEIAKARLEIYAQERLSEEEKTKEFAAKRKEIELKAATDTARARSSMTEQLSREVERINNIITQSRARVEEEQRLNDLMDQRNGFLNNNVTATDLERKRAQDLFDLEQERLRVLRQIALIKDLPEADRLAREKEINAIFDQRRQKTQAQQQVETELMGNFEAGFQRAYRQYAEDSRNAFEIAGRTFSKITQSMEDNIVDFAKTGKFEFKGFLASILEDLLRSQVRQLISQLFGSMSGNNNLVSGFGKLLGFASGGIIPTNGPVIVGERGPELLVGASGSRVIPNDQLGGGQYVTYNISAVDAASFKALVARDPGFIHAVASQGARTVPARR